LPRQEKWMQEAFRKHRGALKQQLQIPKAKKIPISLMQSIMSAPVGQRIRNPTETGKRRITVTKLLKKRVNPVLTARRTR
jgi:hypothetical protein